MGHHLGISRSDMMSLDSQFDNIIIGFSIVVRDGSHINNLDPQFDNIIELWLLDFISILVVMNGD